MYSLITLTTLLLGIVQSQFTNKGQTEIYHGMYECKGHTFKNGSHWFLVDDIFTCNGFCRSTNCSGFSIELSPKRNFTICSLSFPQDLVGGLNLGQVEPWRMSYITDMTFADKMQLQNSSSCSFIADDLGKDSEILDLDNDESLAVLGLSLEQIANMSGNITEPSFPPPNSKKYEHSSEYYVYADVNAFGLSFSLVQMTCKDCDDNQLRQKAVEKFQSAEKVTSDVPPPSSCFPRDAVVELISGKKITIGELDVGDKIKTGPGEYSTVYMFDHKVEDIVSEFVKLSFNDGTRIRMTSSHYIQTASGLATAGSVGLREKILKSTGEWIQVSGISYEKGIGLYNPYTYTGKIVVDGVVTSAFTNDIHPVILGGLYKIVEIIYKTTGYQILGDSLHGVHHPWWAKVLLNVLPRGPARLPDHSTIKSYFLSFIK